MTDKKTTTTDKLRITVYKAEVKKLHKRIAQLEVENRIQARALKEMGVKSVTLMRRPGGLAIQCQDQI